MVSACVLVRSAKGKYDEVLKRIRLFKHVKLAFPVLGRYDIVVDLEAKNPRELAETVLRIGQLAGVIFTETLVEVGKA